MRSRVPVRSHDFKIRREGGFRSASARTTCHARWPASVTPYRPASRSEERRVGKECRSRRSPHQHKKNADRADEIVETLASHLIQDRQEGYTEHTDTAR